jgi:hypothetical protein
MRQKDGNNQFDSTGFYMPLDTDEQVISVKNDPTHEKKPDIVKQFKDYYEPIYQEVSPMEKDWLQFSNDMVDHIEQMRKKYEVNEGVEIAQLLPYSWAIGDAMKYIYEVVRWIEDPEIARRGNIQFIIKENLLKAAHCCQIAYSKIENGK